MSEQFADGVTWVDLASVRDPLSVPMAMASALGFIPNESVPVAEQLGHHLRTRQTLLLIDNCEHLLTSTADLVAQLLTSCPALQVLATSRGPLHLRSEQVLPVAPLPLPPLTDSSLQALTDNDAICLFVERARSVQPGFGIDEGNVSSVAALCRDLDGLPLAIELAAARITLFSPEELLAQMSDRFAVLTDGPRDAPARQRTMREAISWSYDMLAPDEQVLFRRLAVFTGSFTLAAAQAVAGDGADAGGHIRQGLAALVDHHLVRRLDDVGETRFTMLETIREFGLERLEECGEEPEVRTCHATYVRDLVDALDPWVIGHLPDSAKVLDRLETEYPNISAALAWLRDTGDVSGLLDLAGVLEHFWHRRGHVREGREWLAWGFAQDVEVTASARATAQNALGTMVYAYYDYAHELALYEESLGHWTATGGTTQIARVSEHAAWTALFLGEPDRARRYADDALAALETLGDRNWTARAICWMGHLQGCLAWHQGDVDTAEQYVAATIEQQRMFAQESGSEHAFACWPLFAQAHFSRAKGDISRALEHYQRSLAHAERFQEERCIAAAVAGIAGTLAAIGRWPDAARLFGAAEAYCERTGTVFYEDHEVWTKQRSLGLPEPWQQGEPSSQLVPGHRVPVPSPIADPAAASERWAVGRTVPIEEAIAEALAVDLAMPPSSWPGTVAAASNTAATTSGLTPREQEVLALMCAHLQDKEIAERLFLSPRTVEGHVSHILGKLGVSSRREVMALAARQALV